MRVFVFTLAAAFVFTSVAYAEDGWTGFGPDDPDPPKAHSTNPGSPEAAPEPSSSPVPEQPSAVPMVTAKAGADGGTGQQGAKGEKGDPGPQGIQGIQGIQGLPGVNSDLCQNLPGIQTTPGFKRWPQRYWRFKPRLEPRVMTLNRKRQIVCVTLSWMRKHGRA